QNGSYLDTGSPAIFFSDSQTLSQALSAGLGAPVPDFECLDVNGNPLGLYCPAASVSYSAKVYGTSGTPGNFGWNVNNAATLLSGANSVFDSLGGDSGIDLSTDYVDFGLPFFLGRTVFVGFAGTTLPYPLATN